jgi:hypothetical protein
MDILADVLMRASSTRGCFIISMAALLRDGCGTMHRLPYDLNPMGAFEISESASVLVIHRSSFGGSIFQHLCRFETSCIKNFSAHVIPVQDRSRNLESYRFQCVPFGEILLPLLVAPDAPDAIQRPLSGMFT